jgi:arginine utilization regulatory protein
MKPTTPRHTIVRILDIGYEEFLPVFDGFGEGVLIVDNSGTIIYYNTSMASIDDLAQNDVLGMNVLGVYELSEEKSVVMQCLKSAEPIIDRPLLYRTRRGKVANTIHTVFPLFKRKRLEGAICLVREYNVLEETISAVSIPRSKRSQSNDTHFDFNAIIGNSIDFLKAVNTAKRAAATPSPVMLYGETGTGKELFAQAIHNQSGRKKSRYTAVNCAAIPENLLEGLLFGTTKGAFTGANNKLGLFERANGGTIFLDELNSMAVGLQAKILRVIQERKVRRLGALRENEIDVKIISSVNKPPHLSIADNTLRPDLFYRLGVVFIPLPPLRERKEDIELLAWHFLAKHNQVLGRRVTDISSSVLALFNDYDWPGNVRELEHVIEGAINLVVSSHTIERRHLQSHLITWRRLHGQSEAAQPSPMGMLVESSGGAERPTRPLPTSPIADGGRRLENGKGLPDTQADFERQVLTEALSDHRGNITRAAASIGISRQLFNYKLKKYGINRKDYLL